MKLIVLLLTIAIMQVSASSFAQRITLNKTKAPLEQIINEIRTQTGYDFLYNNKLLKKANPVTINVKNAGIEEVLEICFHNQPLTYKIEDKAVWLKEKERTFYDKVVDKLADITVRGKVVDEKGKGLPGATIKLKGSESKVSIVTSTNGSFSIVIPGENAVLLVSYVGYKTKEVNISGADVDLVIRMEPIAGQLEEVAVISTGYQRIAKERVTGSFETINNELINRTNGSNILSRMEGITTGFLVDRRQIGEGNPRPDDISIRGLSTMTSSIAVPLIVLDNFPYTGDINNINPNDVESITVLKDAAAASIWGARAGNGVIVITTKKGAYNQSFQVSFNSSVNITEKPDLLAVPKMNTSDYIDVEVRLFNEGFYDSKIEDIFTWPYLSPVVELLNSARPGGTRTLAEANAQIDEMRFYDVRKDYLKYVYQKAIHQQYALNINGGNNQFNYRISGGFDKDRFNTKKLKSERITTRTDLSYKPVRNLKIESGIFFNQTANNGPTLNSMVTYNQNMIPYTRLADDAGNPLIVGRDISVRFLDAASPEFLDWRYRPLYELSSSSSTNNSYNMLFNLNTAYQISDMFSLDLRYQYGRDLSEIKNLDGINSYYTRNLINLLTEFQSGQAVRNLPVGGILAQNSGNTNLNNIRGQINVNKIWNSNHQLTGIVGVERNERHIKSNSATVYGYNDELLTHKEVNHQIEVVSPISTLVRIPSGIDFTDQNYRFTSLLANASYTYKNRYSFSASGRKDAANLFGVNTNLRGAPFWSSGLSWEVSKESFYKLDMLPYLKLRITYGYQGNTDNNLSAYSTIRYNGNDVDINLPYADIMNPANDDLRWERVGTLNLGLDFSLKNDILSGSLEYYSKHAKDVLFISPLGYTTGFNFTTYNSTALNTRGIDLSLHSKNLPTNSRLKWSTDLIFSYMANKVTSFKPLNNFASDFIDFGLGIPPGQAVGKPVLSVYSYQWAGLDPATGDPQGFIDGQISKDYTALTNIQPDQLKFHGSATPVYSGAFRNTFSFKGFSLSANIAAKLGYYFRRKGLSYNNLFTNGVGHSDFSKRWQHTGDEQNTNVPSLIYPNDPLRDQFYLGSSALVEKADHIRLQDIILTYTLNRPSWKMKNMKIFTNASNLGIIWRANKQGIDPDFFSNYPAPRTIAFGFSANF